MKNSGSDTNFYSIHDNRTTILVRSFRALDFSLDSRYNFERNFNEISWLLSASRDHVTSMPSRFRAGSPNCERKTNKPHGKVSVTTPVGCWSRCSTFAQASTLTRTGTYTYLQQPYQILSSCFSLWPYSGRVTVVALRGWIVFKLRLNSYALTSSQDGRSPLHYASWNGHVEVVTKLIAANAGINLEDKVRTSLRV